MGTRYAQFSLKYVHLALLYSMNRVSRSEVPYINTLELTIWSRYYFSSDMVLISLYFISSNVIKEESSFVNTQISAAALIRVAALNQSFTVLSTHTVHAVTPD